MEGGSRQHLNLERPTRRETAEKLGFGDGERYPATGEDERWRELRLKG